MYKRLKALKEKEEGFTLIELMVVVLIIAILIAIAIPTFLGARQRAQDRAAQSSLRNALTAEKTWYTDNESYTTVPADMDAIEPSLTWQNAASTDPKEVNVSVDPANDQVVCLEALSEAGTTFFLGDVATGANAGTYYGTAALGCTEANVTALPQDGW